MLKIAPTGPRIRGHKKITAYPRYVTQIDNLEGLSEEEKSGLRKVTEKYPFRSNEYYLSLVDWDREDDPIRGIIVPHLDELKEWGRLDASSEDMYTVAPGCQHKYNCTALLLVSDVCGGFCRYCFRKRLFIADNTNEVRRDISQGLEYIEKHKEITNVLLTGGDPLTLPTKKLEQIISQVREIEHVQIIRIGSKIPAYNPYRILNDPSLALMLKR
ncbi:MAG: 4Fe-4S cluster-binding domain-containing protein, partial [Thermodesulfobacteriota bacterium]|nr:4Fe-4S cluster-binding domain-containing protein [Thermodesulfobacteriota bacterium]